MALKVIRKISLRIAAVVNQCDVNSTDLHDYDKAPALQAGYEEVH